MLFADVAGSTALTEELDPEEAHDLLYEATQRMCHVVEQHGGTVCRFMGDGVMAMFGAPVAQENHALHACRAALEMQHPVASCDEELQEKRGGALKIRVGLHSGEVVVLEVGDDEKAEYDASGVTVSLAARMEQSTDPGTVRITEDTYGLIQNHFEVQPLPPARVKGFSEPVVAFRLVRPAESHDERDGLFIGRVAELAQLEASLDTCLSTAIGQTVYVRGDAGIGKTRLTEQAMSAASAKGFSIHRALVLDFGVGQGQDAARTLVRSLLDLSATDDNQHRQGAAEAAVADGQLSRDLQPYLHDLLDLPQPAELRALYEGLDDSTRTTGRRNVVSALVANASAQRPVLIVVEDLHWANAQTLGYLAHLKRSLVESLVVFLMTSRIEGDPLLSMQHVELRSSPLVSIDLGPLRPIEAERLAELYTGDDTAFAHSCVERSEGNPLFLVQLLRSPADRDVAQLPTTLQTLIAARVDRLEATDKKAVQTAAVLGQRFELGPLQAIIGEKNYECRRLIEQQLIRPEGQDFLFVHALVREGVLSTILKTERRTLHRRAAHWYQERDSTLHAQHLDRADDPDAPAAYLVAARIQGELFHFRTALDLAQRGLELASAQPIRFELKELQAEVLMSLGETSAATDAFLQAAELATHTSERCRAWVGAAHGLRDLGQYDQGLQMLDKAEVEAKEQDLLRELSEIHHFKGNIYFVQVDKEQCLAEQEQAYEAARQGGDAMLEAQALIGLFRASVLQGRMRTGAQHITRCMDLCHRMGFERLEHGFTHMIGLSDYYDLQFESGLKHLLAGVQNAPRVGILRSALIANAFAGEMYLEMEIQAQVEYTAKKF